MELIKIENRIKERENSIKKNFWEIARDLKEIKEKKLYLELDFKNITEYSENRLGYKKSMAYNLLKIAELDFSNGLENKSIRELLDFTTEKTEEEKKQEQNIKTLLIKTHQDLIKLKEVYWEMKGIVSEEEKGKDYYRMLLEHYNSRENKEVQKEIIKLENKYIGFIIESLPGYCEKAIKGFNYNVYNGLI